MQSAISNPHGYHKLKVYKRHKKAKQSSHLITREENKRGREEKRPKNKSKTAIRIYISLITLNVNGLNASTKRHRLAKMNTKIRSIH